MDGSDCKIEVRDLTVRYGRKEVLSRISLDIPRSKYFADVINADLVQVVDPSVVFEFAPQDLQILQDGANEKWKRLSDAVVHGAISLEFARAEMGWPESAAPAKQTEPAPAPTALPTEEVEMRAWRRKATKALRAGRSANVPFECEVIDLDHEAAIRAALPGAGLDDLDRIFGAKPAPIPTKELTWKPSRSS
jgi:hypothetical protein